MPGTRVAFAATESATDAMLAGPLTGADEVRTSAGVMTPDGIPPRVRVISASCAGPDVASEVLPGSPRCKDRAGSISAAMTAKPPTAATQRCLYTPPAPAENSRLAERSVRSLGQSSRGPTVARITGSNVTATSTDISGTSTPPYPTLRSIGTGKTILDSNPIATVRPEKTNARP